jgi:hypothetical protein
MPGGSLPACRGMAGSLQCRCDCIGHSNRSAHRRSFEGTRKREATSASCRLKYLLLLGRDRRERYFSADLTGTQCPRRATLSHRPVNVRPMRLRRSDHSSNIHATASVLRTRLFMKVSSHASEVSMRDDKTDLIHCARVSSKCRGTRAPTGRFTGCRLGAHVPRNGQGNQGTSARSTPSTQPCPQRGCAGCLAARSSWPLGGVSRCTDTRAQTDG